MTSRWTTRRNEIKKRRYEEIDEIFQKHLIDVQSNVDHTETGCVNDPVSDAESGNDKGHTIYENLEGGHEAFPEQEPEQESDVDEPSGAKSTVPLKYRLAQFVSEFRLSVEATAALLNILRDEGLDVPKCRVTLLETPKISIIPKRESPGEYIHFGIQRSLEGLAKDRKIASMMEIRLDVNIDGLPIAKNGRCVWPILAAFPWAREISPFVIGCYTGLKEPANFDSYLMDFVTEVNELTQNGIVLKRGEVTERLKFSIRLFICDRPATSKICGVVSHVSKNGCPNCVQVGRRINNVTVYSSLVGTPRDDNSFRSRLDPEHHKVQTMSGIERIVGLDMVRQVGVDPMHTCHLGVTKKILEGMLGKVKKAGYLGARLSKANRQKAASYYSSLAPFIPTDFARHPRSFEELSNFKATEFRLFDSYLGVLVTKKFFSQQLHDHFLLYFCAMRLLSMKDTPSDKIELAQDLLGEFVQQFQGYYGVHSLTHNVHMLLHLAQYVELYGNLPSITAFRFENFMQQIKSFLTKKKHQILQQLHNRLAEQEVLAKKNVNVQITEKFKLKKNLLGCGFAYRTCSFDDQTVISANGRDDCVLIGGTPAKVLGFAEINGTKGAIVQEFSNLQPLFVKPINSSEIGLWITSNINDEIIFVELNSGLIKAIKIPFESAYIIITMLHTGYD